MSSAIKQVESNFPVASVSPFGSGRSDVQRPPVTATLPQRKLSRQEMDALAKELNDVMRIISTKLSFTVDRVTNKTVVKVLDADTQELIRQIPPEEMLRVAARITELLGVLYDETR